MLFRLLRLGVGLALAIVAAVGIGNALGLPLVPPATSFEPPLWRIAKASVPYLPLVLTLALAVIAAAEARRYRHWLFWALSGMAIAGLCMFAIRNAGAVSALIEGRAPLKFGVMGAAGGLVYWLLAGRRSGDLAASVAHLFGSGALSDREEQRRCALCSLLWLLVGLIPLGLLGWQAYHRGNEPVAQSVAAKAEGDAARMLERAGLGALKFRIGGKDGEIGHVMGTVENSEAKVKAFEAAKTALHPLVGVPGVVAILQNDILAKDDADPQVAAENARIRGGGSGTFAAEAAAKRKAEEEAAHKKAEKRNVSPPKRPPSARPRKRLRVRRRKRNVSPPKLPLSARPRKKLREEGGRGTSRRRSCRQAQGRGRGCA